MAQDHLAANIIAARQMEAQQQAQILGDYEKPIEVTLKWANHDWFAFVILAKHLARRLIDLKMFL